MDWTIPLCQQVPCRKVLLPLFRQILDLALPKLAFPQQMLEGKFNSTQRAHPRDSMEGALMQGS